MMVNTIQMKKIMIKQLIVWCNIKDGTKSIRYFNRSTEDAFYVNTLHSSENSTDYNHYLFTIKDKKIGSNHRFLTYLNLKID